MARPKRPRRRGRLGDSSGLLLYVSEYHGDDRFYNYAHYVYGRVAAWQETASVGRTGVDRHGRNTAQKIRTHRQTDFGDGDRRAALDEGPQRRAGAVHGLPRQHVGEAEQRTVGVQWPQQREDGPGQGPHYGA